MISLDTFITTEQDVIEGLPEHCVMLEGDFTGHVARRMLSGGARDVKNVLLTNQSQVRKQDIAGNLMERIALDVMGRLPRSNSGNS